MTKPPRYARFHKCDLQMQTPADGRHWVGTRTRLAPTASDDEIARAARLYVDRLYEVGLDVVGITDHNLGGELGVRFLKQLVEETKTQAGDRNRRIQVFPGFELMASIPGRVHLLCLFELATDVDYVDQVLTVLLGAPRGTRPADAPSTLGLNDILERVGGAGGIVVAAHADRAKGALDDHQMATGWQQDVVTNEGLLCIELCKPREDYEQASGKLGMIVRNDAGPWHRSHPIAVVNSSDCKRLDPDDGKGDESWIGKRHTWIKMSVPSIEGLRQAFLDHDSRIRFGAIRPEDQQHHDRIERISIEGVRFLADQDIDVSPNLNVFIGGGGTGKSTILEYLRGMVGRPPETTPELTNAHKTTLSTLGTGTVAVRLRQGGEVMTVTSGERSDRPDIADRFPVVAFSQREVFAVASSQPATLALIDGLQRDRMDELARVEARLQEALRQLDDELAALPQLESQHQRVEAEVARLLAALDAVEAQQRPLAVLNQHLREAEAVEKIDAGLNRVAGEIESFADSLALGIGQSGFRSPDTPHAHEVGGLLERAQAVVERATAEITSASAAVRHALEAERQCPERAEWHDAVERARAAYQTLRPTSGGEAEEEPELLRRQLELRQAEVTTLEDQIAGLREREASRPERLQDLHEIWDRQIGARQETASALKDLVPRTESGEPYVEVDIEPFADTEPLRRKLNEWIHGQALSESEAAEICMGAVEEAEGGSPVDVLVGWLHDLARGITPLPLKVIGLRDVTGRRLVENLDQNRVRELERLRLPDKAVVRLRRNDGDVAGSLDEGLSVGQRCTAILALAVASGREPIIIDQPEDEIDNEFIYTELVPLLRRAKNQRQVIIATHNPNLPVNGDAELIYALEARRVNEKVRGRPKIVDGQKAFGSLDQRPVKAAVEEIMEGSEEAFNRRRVRYGF